MAVVLIVHARGTDSLRALLAEVLDALVGMPLAGDYLHDRLAALVGHAQDREELEVGLEQLGPRDVGDLLVADGAAVLRCVVNDVVYA